jgi:hypothetical protein
VLDLLPPAAVELDVKGVTSWLAFESLSAKH